MSAQFRDVQLGQATVELSQRDDGSMILKTRESLPAYPDTLMERLDHWAEVTPDQIFVAQRDDNDQWRKLTYAQTRVQVRKLAQALLNAGLSAERPLMILSGNSIEHLLMALAAMYVGIPYAPISPAYSLVSKDFGKLKHINGLLTPGMVFVDNASPFEDAVNAVIADDCQKVAVNLNDVSGNWTAFADMLETPDTDQVQQAHDAVTPDTIAKFLFTSGSTGMPKGVINTNRMLSSNQEMLVSLMTFMRDEPPVIVDWLPWNHTFGGNHNVGIVLYNGGSLYIDDGKPTEQLIQNSIRNLKEISPTLYFNVPKGFEFLVEYLEQDDQLRENFFKDLKLTFFAGAGLAQHVWDKLDQMAIKTLGCKVGMLTGLGATETAPSAMFASLEESQSGVIGIPALGVDIKLVPNSGKLEVRVKGPNVMPGYWRQPDITAKSFDDEGYYCLGDAAKFIDPEKPQRGMRFDGRISEDFKLDTGTWVSVGPLRAKIIATGAPYIQDVVIAGHNRGYLSIMVFPEMEHCRQLSGLGADSSIQEVVNSPEVKAQFEKILKNLYDSSTGSSTRVERLVVLNEPPKMDAHEITDKGSINQRAVLENRDQVVQDLYSDNPSSQVLRLA